MQVSFNSNLFRNIFLQIILSFIFSNEDIVNL